MNVRTRVRSIVSRPPRSIRWDDAEQTAPIVNRPLHWFALYTYWKTLPITIGVVTLVSLLPGVVALLIILGFGLFYEYGDELPEFLENTVLQDVIDYELQGFGPIWDQLRTNRYHPELTIILGLAAVAWVVVRTLQWRSTRYGADAEHIWIQGGIVWHWERRLPMERVQSVELYASWLHRLLDLRAVEVHSAAPDRTVASIQLAAIPTAEAIELQKIMLSATQGVSVDRLANLASEREEVQLASITTAQLLAAGLTSFEIRLSFVGIIAAFHLFSKSFLKTWRNDLIDWFVRTIERKHALIDLLDVALLLLVLFWAFSIVTFVLTFSRFRLQRLGHLALIEHGLVTKRWRAVLLPRVQAITFVETPIQERRRTGSLRMELAGMHQRSLDLKMLLPSLPRDQALGTLERLFGGTVYSNIANEVERFQRIPASAKGMYTMYWPYRLVGLAIGLAALDWLSPDIRFEHPTLIGIALLAIPGYFYGRRQFLDAGWLIDDDREVIVRERHINRRTIVCSADRLQWRGMRQMTLPYRPAGPATVVAYVAAAGKVDSVGRAFMPIGWPFYDGRLRIRGLPEADARSLLDQLGPQSSDPLYRPHVV